MKNYIVLFREPDGRTEPHPDADIQQHRQNWKVWMEKWTAAGNLTGGSSLTLEGNLIKGREASISKGIYKNGMEIVGGFLLLKAENLDEATAIAGSCPIYEFDGYAEVRELQ